MLMAALDYSIHHYVVYVAAKAPAAVFSRRSPRAFDRTIIYIPIGQLSPVSLKKIRVVHVLDGYDKRDIAKDLFVVGNSSTVDLIPPNADAGNGGPTNFQA